MANQYIGAMSALWNVGATTYYGIKMDVTDSASAAASKLIALQVGSVDMFSVSKAGAVVAAAGGTFAGALAATTLTLSGALSAVTSLTVTSADAGAAAGPAIVMDRNSATPAASDVIGVIYWNGRDSGGNAHTYADMFVTMTDVTNGSEDGTVTIRNSVAGSLTTQATITATGWNAMNIGATTRGTGAFTTLAANSTVTFTAGGSMTGTWSNLGTVTTVDINGGTITGITDLAVADGGTGASTAANARTNLGLGTIATQAASAVAITGGTIDGAVIGGSTPAAGSFTTLSATGTATLVAANLTGNLGISKASPTITFTETVSGAVSSIFENGGQLIYSADTANTVVSSFHIWRVDGTQKFAVGASSASFSAGVSLTASGGGSLTGTWSDLGTVTTVDINGGTIDGAVIGGASAAAISGTTGTFSSVHRALRYGIDRSPSFEIDAYKTGAANATINVANDTVQGIFQVSSTVQANFGTISNHPVSLRVNNLGVGEITSTGLNSTAIGATTRSTGAFTTLAANSTVTFTNGGSLTGTWSNLGTVTTVDINGGTIDGTTIGATSATTGKFTTVDIGSITAVSDAILNVRELGNGIEFGHSNAAGYASTIGCEANTGASFIAFNAEAGTNINTYRTRGISGTVLRGNLAGGLQIQNVATASADNQTATTIFTVASTGAVTLTGTLTASSGGSLTGTWSNLGTVTTVDINGGTIDGAVIGGTSAAAISGTTGAFSSQVTGASFVATTVNAIFATSAAGTVFLRPNGSGSTTGQLTVNSAGALTVNGTITTTAGGSLTGTWTSLGTVTTVDINGGTIDGAVIGGASAAAGTFTTLAASGVSTLTGQTRSGSGTAAAPAYSFTSDTNTGIYSPVGDAIGFAANGSAIGTWDATGIVLSGAASFSATNASAQVNLGVFSASGGADGIRATVPTLFMSSSTTAKTDFLVFYNPNAVVGGISATGTATTYAVASDHRLPWKEGRTAIEDSGSFIDALKPYYFPKAGKSGFVAHEFAEVSPQSVVGEKDAVKADGSADYQMMQASTDDVVANMVAEMQSLRVRLAELEAA